MGVVSALIAWSLRNRVLVLAAAVVLVALGVRGAWTLPIDAVPDVTNVQVQIITTAPALSPVEVEQYVSVPVERSMAGIPRTTTPTSITWTNFMGPMLAPGLSVAHHFGRNGDARSACWTRRRTNAHMPSERTETAVQTRASSRWCSA